MKRKSDNHYYEKFEDGTVNDITEEIPFDIPDSWRWTRINSYVQKVTDYVASGSFASLNQNVKYYKEKNYALLVRTVDLSNNFTNEPVYTDEHGYNFLENSNLFGGELVLSNVGSIGKVFIVPQLNKKMTLAPNSIMVRCFSNEHINWLYNLFDSSFGLTILLSISSATAIKKFNKTGFKTLMIPIPPIKEQLKIVKELKKYKPFIEKYDETNTKLENLNNNYKEELKKSILQYAIQGKLVKQDPNDESAEVLINKILEEKRELIKTKQIKKENLSVIYKDSTDNQFYEKFDDGTINNITDQIPFELPNNWTWTKLRNIGIYKKGPFGSALTKNLFVPKSTETIKVYEQKNAIQKNVTLGEYYITKDYFENHMTGFEVLPNDIIVSCAGTIGETYVMPKEMERGIINQALMRMRISELFSQDYFLLYFDYVLKKSSAKKSNGSAIKNIPPFDVFKEFLVAIPPIEEQKRILNKLKILFNIIETAE